MPICTRDWSRIEAGQLQFSPGANVTRRRMQIGLVRLHRYAGGRTSVGKLFRGPVVEAAFPYVQERTGCLQAPLLTLAHSALM